MNFNISIFKHLTSKCSHFDIEKEEGDNYSFVWNIDGKKTREQPFFYSPLMSDIYSIDKIDLVSLLEKFGQEYTMLNVLLSIMCIDGIYDKLDDEDRTKLADYLEKYLLGGKTKPTNSLDTKASPFSQSKTEPN